MSQMSQIEDRKKRKRERGTILKNAILYGMGAVSDSMCVFLGHRYNIIACADADQSKWGKERDRRPFVKIIPPHKIPELEYDEIIVSTRTKTAEITAYLIGLGLPKEKINTYYSEHYDMMFGGYFHARIMALGNVSDMIHAANITGSVAEAGVYRGAFAKHINYFFSDRELLLFDTFKGFSENMLTKEKSNGGAAHIAGFHSDTSVDLVRAALPFPQKCRFYPGYFPASANGIEDSFAFVNIDMDIYESTLEGLKFFYPRMAENGVIFVHDYFDRTWGGVKKAVDEYRSHAGGLFKCAPLGDGFTLAIVK
jgi:O-methyltransferase